MKKRKSAILVWTPPGGSVRQFMFDVVETEKTNKTSVISDYPIEEGADVTDNIRTQLAAITLEGIVSQSPLEDVNNRGASSEIIELNVPVYTPPLVPTPGSFFQTIRNALRKAPPTSHAVMTFNSSFNAVSEAQEMFDQLQTSATLFELYTTTAYYKNIAIQSVDLSKDSSLGSSGRFSITFRQIKLVETRLVNAPVPTETRAKTAIKKGAQGTSTPTPQLESQLHKGSSWIKNKIGAP